MENQTNSNPDLIRKPETDSLPDGRGVSPASGAPAGALEGAVPVTRRPRRSPVKTIVGVGLFTAIVVVLQMLGGSIKFGMFSISLVLVPIVVGAAVYGWGAGAWLGFVFGLTVLLGGDAAPFMTVNAPGTILTVLLKGIACGMLSGLVYKGLRAAIKGEVGIWIAVIAAAIVCPVVNTGVFLAGCQLFFLETITEWGKAAGFENAGAYMFLGLAGVNFLVEIGVNMALSPAITRLIKIGRK